VDLASILHGIGFSNIRNNNGIITKTSANKIGYDIFTECLIDIPKLSTVSIARLINRIVRQLPSDQSYLNIGMWHGYSFFAGMAGNSDKRCIGVDKWCDTLESIDPPRNKFNEIYNRVKSPLSIVYDMDFRQLFFDGLLKGERVGLYFYDADHNYQPTLDALELADPYVVAGGLVMIDDINTDFPCSATMDFLASDAGKKYKVVMWINTENGMDPWWWNGIAILEKWQ